MSTITSAKKSFLFALLIGFSIFIQGLYFYTYSNSRALLIITTLLTPTSVIVFLLIRYWWKVGRVSEIKIFGIVLIIIGIAYVFVFTPFSAPDEPYHYLNSYRYSNLFLLSLPQDGLMYLRVDDVSLTEHSEIYLSRNSYATVVDQFSFLARDATLIPLSNENGIFPNAQSSMIQFSSNPFQLKFASGIGIALARLLGLGSLPLFYIGRIFNFLLFAGLSIAAIKITPILKRPMMVICLLPMTMHICASYSYDAGIIGWAFLLSALCFKAIYSERKMDKRLIAAIVLVTIVLAPCKVIYTLIILLVYLIPSWKFSSRKVEIVFKIGVLILAALAILGLRASELLNMAGVQAPGSGTELDIRGSEEGTFYSLSFFFENPLGAILMYMRTFEVVGDFYLATTLGGLLGWFQPGLDAPWYAVSSLLLVLIFSFIKCKGEPEIPILHRVSSFAIAFTGWLLLMTALLLAWTFTSENVIEGVQGRYLLPLMPLIALASQCDSFVAQRDYSKEFVAVMAVLNCLYLIRITSIAFTM